MGDSTHELPPYTPPSETVEVETPYFEFIDVWKGFDGLSVLEDVSFSVARGETLCILGRSGVGKSVTLKLIMGFLRPDRGRVFADGIDVPALSERELTEMHKKITMVFQSGALFDSLTVGENVAFAMHDDGHELSEEEVNGRVDQLLRLLDLEAYRDRYPASLSTGMKRAVAIARALAIEPQAILYDEPTTMVDPMMSRTISDLIERVKRQVRLTSIVVTHDTMLARQLADHLVMLHEGKVRFFGTVAEIDASRDAVVAEFLRQDALALP